MKYSAKVIGFLQAFGLAAYVASFAFSVQTLAPLLQARFPIDPEPVLPITLVLLAFVTSALICVSIAFGYPVYLYLHAKKESAMPVVLWTALWLVVISSVVLGGVLLLS